MSQSVPDPAGPYSHIGCTGCASLARWVPVGDPAPEDLLNDIPVFCIEPRCVTVLSRVEGSPERCRTLEIRRSVKANKLACSVVELRRLPTPAKRFVSHHLANGE